VRFTEVGQLRVAAPAEAALAVLWDIRSIASYEPKVRSATVSPSGARNGTFFARGSFTGLPWSGTFTYQLTRSGFYSRMKPGALGLQVQGGFFVASASACQCVITHYERYECPCWLSPLTVPARSYLRRAIKEELDALARLICREQGGELLRHDQRSRGG